MADVLSINLSIVFIGSSSEQVRTALMRQEQAWTLDLMKKNEYLVWVGIDQKKIFIDVN
jgi:hypothetical protein